MATPLAAPFADLSWAPRGRGNFATDIWFRPSPEQPYHYGNGATDPVERQMSSSLPAVPMFPSWQYDPHLLQTTPPFAMAQHNPAAAPTGQWPATLDVYEYGSDILAQDSATEFFPAMNWGQIHTMTQDKLPAPTLEMFLFAARKVLPSWLQQPRSAAGRYSIHRSIESNAGAFRYWTEEAHKDPRAIELARRHGILIPPDTDHEYQWDPLYPMRRLVLIGEDKWQNLAVFFGPTWHQDTQYYHWICRMSVFFPPEIGTWHRFEQSRIDESVSEDKWSPRMAYPIESTAIRELINQQGLEIIMHRIKQDYRLRKWHYLVWPYDNRATFGNQSPSRTQYRLDRRAYRPRRKPREARLTAISSTAKISSG